MELHAGPHPLAGQEIKVRLKGGHPQIPNSRNQEIDFIVEDWADTVFGEFWGNKDGNPTAIIYAMRAGMNGLPLDNEVLYGKVNGLAHLIHVTEIVQS